jgi:hypothetical protein
VCRGPPCSQEVAERRCRGLDGQGAGRRALPRRLLQPPAVARVAPPLPLGTTMAGAPWGCHGSNGMHAMQADDAQSLHAPGVCPPQPPWALGACAEQACGGYMAAQPAAHDSLGDSMRDENSAPMPLSVWAHRRLSEPGAGSGTAMDEDGCMGQGSVSGGGPTAPLRVGPTASFVAASIPFSAAHRRPGTAASADTVHKWEQLLRDHPNDPMVSAFSLAPAPRSLCLPLAVRET